MENIALQSLQIFSLLCYARKLLPLLRPKVVAISVRKTIMRKFANFVRLYFPHITTFFNHILGFYYFLKVPFGNVVFLVGICLEQKLVYKENCLLRSQSRDDDKNWPKTDDGKNNHKTNTTKIRIVTWATEIIKKYNTTTSTWRHAVECNKHGEDQYEVKRELTETMRTGNRTTIIKNAHKKT